MKLPFILLFLLVLSPAFIHADPDLTQGEDIPENYQENKSSPSVNESDILELPLAEGSEDGKEDLFSNAETTQLSQDTFQFQAEINRLMNLLVNSIYSNRDVFLRELISNASDAIDKMRYLALVDESIKEKLGSDFKPEIRIKADPENKLLYIFDNGIGMTHDQLVNNLGRIAKSGTSEFIEKFAQSDDVANLDSQIGRFGVGFYSAFLVSDHVSVTTKSFEDNQYIWKSDSSDLSSYSISEDPRGNTLFSGTVVTLHLKDDQLEYLKQDKLKSLIVKYSDFINFPIYLWTTNVKTTQEPSDSDNNVSHDKPKNNVDDGIDTVGDVDEQEQPTGSSDNQKNEIKQRLLTWDLVNVQKPLWTRLPSEISDEEYTNFFHRITNSQKKYLGHIHFKVEGDISFTALLFIPEEPPFNVLDQSLLKGNLKLFVRRVFITDNFEDGIPRYLAFVNGIIDSDNLPLNVSREVLQKHKTMEIIRRKIVSKLINYIVDMQKNNPDIYAKFYEGYADNLKIGVVEDNQYRDRLSTLVQFNSIRYPDSLITIDKYIEEMKPEQETIYFLGGESMNVIKASPFLEFVNAKGYDVLVVTKALDAYVLERLHFYNGKKRYLIEDLGKEEAYMDKHSLKRIEEIKGQFEPLIQYLTKDSPIASKIIQAKLTLRLRKNPFSLVAFHGGYSANIERILRAQYVATNTVIRPRHTKVLEVNPRHPIVKRLLNLVENKELERASKTVTTLYEAALVASGYSMEDPLQFTRILYGLVANSVELEDDWESDLEHQLEEEDRELSLLQEEKPPHGEEASFDSPKDELEHMDNNNEGNDYSKSPQDEPEKDEL